MNLCVPNYDDLDETFKNLNSLTGSVSRCETPQQCIDNCDVVVFMHPDKKYATLNVEGKSIIDNWGVL